MPHAHPLHDQTAHSHTRVETPRQGTPDRALPASGPPRAFGAPAIRRNLKEPWCQTTRGCLSIHKLRPSNPESQEIGNRVFITGLDPRIPFALQSLQRCQQLAITAVMKQPPIWPIPAHISASDDFLIMICWQFVLQEVLLAEFRCCGVHVEKCRRWCKQLLRLSQG